MMRGCGPLAGLTAIGSAAQSANALQCLASVLVYGGHRQCITTVAPAASGTATAAVAAPGPAPSPVPSAASQDPIAELPLKFSLRPSVLSPLFATWDQARKAAARKQHIKALMKAHIELAASLPASSPRSVFAQVRQRRDALRNLSALLKQTEREPPLAALASCASPEQAAAYCAALEDATRVADPAAQGFAAVQRGETSPWTYYLQHFHERYRNTPRLQPLEVIYSKPDPVQLLQQMRVASAALPSTSSSSSSSSSSTSMSRVGGPHIDVAGVTHAAGKRKASTATLQLVPGSGSITVNGLPLASYFRDAATRAAALETLTVVGAEVDYDVIVTVRGGGPTGQANAVRTALARALCVRRPGLAGKLEAMTRWDGRVVERKKPAREKARRGYTWVKR